MAENMLLSDALKLIDRTAPPNANADISDFERDLNTNTYIGWSEQWEQRIKAYGISTWLCTDTQVGVVAVFFDDEFVALTKQSARKSDTFIKYASVEVAEKLRAFIIEIDGKELIENVIAPDEVIEAHWFDTIHQGWGYTNLQQAQLGK